MLLGLYLLKTKIAPKLYIYVICAQYLMCIYGRHISIYVIHEINGINQVTRNANTDDDDNINTHNNTDDMDKHYI